MRPQGWPDSVHSISWLRSFILACSRQRSVLHAPAGASQTPCIARASSGQPLSAAPNRMHPHRQQRWNARRHRHVPPPPRRLDCIRVRVWRHVERVQQHGLPEWCPPTARGTKRFGQHLRAPPRSSPAPCRLSRSTQSGGSSTYFARLSASPSSAPWAHHSAQMRPMNAGMGDKVAKLRALQRYLQRAQVDGAL